MCSFVCVCVWGSVCLLTPADAHWTEDDLLIGDSMEHIEEEDQLGGPFSVFAAEASWIPSTSPHALSWCSAVGGKPHKHTVSNQAVALPHFLITT